MALFPSPLAERSVTVSVSLRSPAVKLVASRRQVTRSATLALRISRTAWLLNADHLCPFALWTTFSSSPLEPSPSRREVEGRVLIAQEHQPSPPEPDVRLVTASGSHGISYVFLIHTGCMPDQRDSSHRNLHGESSDGMWCKQEFVYD